MSDPSGSEREVEGGEARNLTEVASRQGMQALLTRPREESQSLAAALALRDVGAVIEPMMEVHYCVDAALDLAAVQAILCTSANGVRALARVTGERRLPLLAVGEATASRARAEGFTAVSSAGGVVADLVRLTASRLRPQSGRLLHVAGDVAAGDLVGALRAQGFVIERRVLYEARPVEGLSTVAVSALRGRTIDFALFFSPRTAAIFVRLAGIAGAARCCRTITSLAISTAADAVLTGLTWRDRRVAKKPNQPALLDTLDAILAERRQG
jgi:uroporphyrinogen-III synthase